MWQILCHILYPHTLCGDTLYKASPRKKVLLFLPVQGKVNLDNKINYIPLISINRKGSPCFSQSL